MKNIHLLCERSFQKEFSRTGIQRTRREDLQFGMEGREIYKAKVKRQK